MHDRIDKVEVYLEICELLEHYSIMKSVRFIQENENNECIGKELMNSMADFTKRYCIKKFFFTKIYFFNNFLVKETYN